MKYLLSVIILLSFCFSQAQEAIVDIRLSPAGSFKVKSNEVTGSAVSKAGQVQAQNIVVGLKNVETGITLRDTHTKKHLEVEKFPEAVLVSATGTAGKGQGKIRIHGVEKEITGTYEAADKTLTAHFDIKLSDFGITGIKYMGVGVKDEASITVKVPLAN